MRQAAKAERRLADRNCSLLGQFPYFDKDFAKESPRLGPLLWKYLNLCFLRAAPHGGSNPRRRSLPACQTINMPSRIGLRWYLKCNGTVVDIPKSQADTPHTVTHF